MRALLFPGNNDDLDIAKAALLEELAQLHFAESEPVIRAKRNYSTALNIDTN